MSSGLRTVASVWLLLGVCFVTVGAQQSLYSPSDPVVQLDRTNFTTSILGTPNAWLVEFYAVWCGHCQRFAPVFNGFANDVIEWGDVFQVAVVACSDPKNLQLCTQYGVRGYPTMKFFPPFAQEGFRGYPFRGTATTTGLRASALRYLKDLSSQGLQPASWPHLTPYGSMEDIRTAYAHLTIEASGVQGRTRRLYIIVESGRNSDTGTTIILDLVNHYPEVMVATISEADSGLSNVRSPALYRQDSNSVIPRLILGRGTRRTLRAAIWDDINNGVVVTTTTTTLAPSTTPLDPIDYNPSDGLHMQDLESNLYYSLWVEVATNPNISGASLRALKSYIDILDRYHPGDSHVRRLLYKVNSWLRINEDEVIPGTRWASEITQLQSEDAYVPHRLAWTGCTGTEPRFRGYPCSLWMTFHALTIGALYWERHNPHFNPLDVLGPIAGYVEHYFSCRYCAEHFMRMASNMARDINKRHDVVLWLWKAHNKANSRLHNDATEDPTYPKIQFPSHEACPRCRAPGAPSGLFDNRTAWNENEVVRYLTTFYGHSYVIDDDSEERYVPDIP